MMPRDPGLVLRDRGRDREHWRPQVEAEEQKTRHRSLPLLLDKPDEQMGTPRPRALLWALCTDNSLVRHLPSVSE